jgi:hypothetical protein
MPKDKFENYDYQSQARSINGRLSRLEKAIRANIRRAATEKRQNPINERIKNLEDIVARLRADHASGLI